MGERKVKKSKLGPRRQREKEKMKKYLDHDWARAARRFFKHSFRLNVKVYPGRRDYLFLTLYLGNAR